MVDIHLLAYCARKSYLLLSKELFYCVHTICSVGFLSQEAKLDSSMLRVSDS